MSQYLGDISAYALAVSQGYTGTEEEYAELMASYATVGQTAVTAAQTATTKASEAATSATTATNKASEATTAATTATTKAGEASTSASTATSAKDTAVSAASTATTKATEATTAAATAVSAKDDAVSANTAAQSAKTAAQTAQTGAETAAASVQSSADQITQNASDISQLKSDLDSINCSTIFDGGYRVTNAGTIGDLIQSSDYVSAVIAVTKGDVVKLSGAGTSSARLWCTADIYGNTIRVSDANLREINLEISIEEDECYFCYNSSAGSNVLRLMRSRAQINNANKELIYNLEKTVQYKTGLRNNLSSDGVDNLLPCTIYRNGVIDNTAYGRDGAFYVIKAPEFRKIHVYFEYQFAESIPWVSNTSNIEVFALGSRVSPVVRFSERQYNASVFGGRVIKRRGLAVSNGSNVKQVWLDQTFYRTHNGKHSIYLKYLGDATVNTGAYVSWSSGVLNFYSGSNALLGTVTYNATDTIQSLIDKCNAVTDIECGGINTDGTCSDLLFAGTMPLVNESSAFKLFIPFARNDEWHTFEAIVDRDTGMMYGAFDGYTVFQTLNTEVDFDSVVQIGGVFAQTSTTKPMVLRNLEIDYDSYGSAEILTGAVCSEYPTSNHTQLISEHNPRLLIFEGHGIDVCTEAESPLSDDMATSTDRLNIVFSTLKRIGYTAITWEDLKDWKLGKKILPKRCYLTMFDDYRVENYVDYDKRKPFVQNNIYAGLAIVSDQYALTDTITVNNIEYTIEQIFTMIVRNGWYPTSHTSGHNNMGNMTFAQAETILKESVLSCDAHGIHSDVLVYPYGALSLYALTALMDSDFKIGVDINQDRYNCKALNNYRFSRTEIGARATINNVLLPFI